jgi:transketolase
MSDLKMEQLAINTIRTLSIDAVQAAKSGHPGTPMALAPLVYTIWNRAMRRLSVSENVTINRIREAFLFR